MTSAQHKFSEGSRTGSSGTVDLLEVYKLILDEYRFQVQFNWERLRYCLTLSVTLTAAAFGLLHVRDGIVLSMAAIIAFTGATAVAMLGIRVIERGREYYQRIRAKKADAERALRLRDIDVDGVRVNLAIESTEGMRSEAVGQSDSDLIGKQTINPRFVQMFWLLAIINGVAALAVTSRLIFSGH